MKVNIEVTAGPARGRVFAIDQADLFIVGRAKDSKISLPNDPYLSRQHFVLEIVPPNCKITDLGSKNGTFVNGVRYGGKKADAKVKQAPDGAVSVTIQTGEIVVGDTRMKISVEQRLARAEHRSDATVVRRAQSVAAATRIECAHPPVPVSENITGIEADSSLGFLSARPPAALQAAPVPPPATNAGAIVFNAAPASRIAPGINAAALAAHSGELPESPRPDDAVDSRAETVRGNPSDERTVHEPPPTTGSERTLLEAPPPGVDAGTIIERLDADAFVKELHAPARESDDKLCCVLCGKDVSSEVGARGRIAGADYVCHTCRASRAFNAKERVARNALPKPAQASPRLPATPGMDLSKFGGVKYFGYQVIDVLGSGGMGVVYKAVREKDGIVVAIKSLLPNVPVSFENYRVFHREIELTSKLKHPNIVEVLDHGHVKGAYYCVLEFVDGMSLKDYVAQMGGKLSLKQAAPLMLDTLSGLAAAHNANIETRSAGPRMQSGIVHRDLKPENILLRRDAFGWIPKIADFGIAKNFESAGMTDMTIAGVCGTPTYWPREQLTHYRYLHPATDVFSIAAVFYEILSGKCARPGMQETLVQCHRRSVSPELADFMRVIGSNPIPPIREAVPSLPLAVAQVIDKALQEVEVPLDEVEMRETLQRLRYANAGAFREALTKAFKASNIGL